MDRRPLHLPGPLVIRHQFYGPSGSSPDISWYLSGWVNGAATPAERERMHKSASSASSGYFHSEPSHIGW